MLDIVAEINALKKSKNATILAHYYQEGEIQELADFTGDSLKLARRFHWTSPPGYGSALDAKQHPV